MLWAWSKRLFLFFYFAEFVATRVPEPREDGAVWVIPLPPSSCGFETGMVCFQRKKKLHPGQGVVQFLPQKAVVIEPRMLGYPHSVIHGKLLDGKKICPPGCFSTMCGGISTIGNMTERGRGQRKRDGKRKRCHRRKNATIRAAKRDWKP